MDKEVLKVRINNRITAHLMHGAIVPGVEDAIIDIIAPELEKAAKWEKVEEIAKWEGIECSPDCPMINTCKSSLCVGAFELVEALNQPDEVKPCQK